MLSFEDKQFIISRVLFCQSIFYWKGKRYYVDKFAPFHKLNAEIIYRDIVENSYECLSEEELNDWMIRNRFWSADQERQLIGYQQDVEKLKIQILESAFKSNTKEVARSMLRKAEDELSKLESIKYQYRYISREGMGIHAKMQYLVGSALKTINGDLVFKNDFWDRRLHPLIIFATSHYLENKVNEKQVRTIARTDPWLSMWNASDSCKSVFDSYSTELTEEQKALIMWTRAYENVRSAEGMTDEIIHDDDMFDGWLLKQSKTAKINKDAEWIDSKINNDKIRNSENIFIMTETDDDIKRIADVNDAHAKFIKKSLMRDVSSAETVRDQDTGVAKDKMRQQYVAMMSQRAKNK